MPITGKRVGPVAQNTGRWPELMRHRLATWHGVFRFFTSLFSYLKLYQSIAITLGQRSEKRISDSSKRKSVESATVPGCSVAVGYTVNGGRVQALWARLHGGVFFALLFRFFFELFANAITMHLIVFQTKKKKLKHLIEKRNIGAV